MAGLDPAIQPAWPEEMRTGGHTATDGRVKPGHDEVMF